MKHKFLAVTVTLFLVQIGYGQSQCESGAKGKQFSEMTSMKDGDSLDESLLKEGSSLMFNPHNSSTIYSAVLSEGYNSSCSIGCIATTGELVGTAVCSSDLTAVGMSAVCPKNTAMLVICVPKDFAAASGSSVDFYQQSSASSIMYNWKSGLIGVFTLFLGLL